MTIKEEISLENLGPSIESNIEGDLSSMDSSSLNNPPLSDYPSQLIPESTSPSRSNSRTSSETKIDSIKVKFHSHQQFNSSFDLLKNISTTTPKYHVIFSPKSSTNINVHSTKIKPKRKPIEENKDENENETQSDVQSSSTTEQSKNPSATAPVTRRSISTRSIPNTAVEQEEEKLRRYFPFVHSIKSSPSLFFRFSAMLLENPNSWQSQSMTIIQFLLAQK